MQKISFSDSWLPRRRASTATISSSISSTSTTTINMEVASISSSNSSSPTISKRTSQLRRPASFSSLSMSSHGNGTTKGNPAAPAPTLVSTIVSRETKSTRRQLLGESHRLGTRLRQLFRKFPVTLATIDARGEEEDDATNVNPIDHSVPDIDDSYTSAASAKTMTKLPNNKNTHLPPQIRWEKHAHRPARHSYSRNNSSSSNDSGHSRWHLTWQRSPRNSTQVGQLPREDTSQKNTTATRRLYNISYARRSEPTVAATDLFNNESLLGNRTLKITTTANDGDDDDDADHDDLLALLQSSVKNARNASSRSSPMRTDVRTIFMDPAATSSLPSSPSSSHSNDYDNSMPMSSYCIQDEDKEWLVQMEPYDDLILSN
ncbi:hypothetical protein BDF22DRAFT_242268 [Syncephalis plumigaleata]|nr:hypothetical protein BDF22DRAFT_242268 [Syncephalis plumigaleata]